MRGFWRGCAIALLVAACGDDAPPGDPDGGGDPEPCVTASDCDDLLFCTGVETCDPSDPAANAAGCVMGDVPCEARFCSESTDECMVTCDADGDGVDSVECGGNDCDDDDGGRFPGNAEVCDPEGVDEDCDPCTVGDRDVDGDFFISSTCRNDATGTPSCGPGVSVEGGVVRGLDCDDESSSVKPGESETCNLIDDDCDGNADEGIVRGEYWPDRDNDGFGDEDGTVVMACARPAGTADNDFDCNDTEATTSPVSAETCDGVDNDCDDSVDEGGMNTYCRDNDDDGFGDPGVTMETTECVPPSGYTASCGDCNDNDPAINPAATEICNGLDDDCNGLPVMEDVDGDGHSPTGHACRDMVAGAFPKDDCDDARAWVHPGAPEFCSNIDEDCDTTNNEDSDGQCATGVCGPNGCVTEERIDLADASACAIGSAGVYCWGDQSDKFTGEGNTLGGSGPETVLSPRLVMSTTNATQVSVGPLDNNACARRSDGILICWGANYNGELGTGTDVAIGAPMSVPGIGDGMQVVAGQGYACARTYEGRVWCWGQRSEGRLGIGGSATDMGIVAPTELDLTGVVELASAARTTCARRFDGSVSCWGAAYAGTGAIGPVTAPTAITLPGPALRLRGGGYIGFDHYALLCAQTASDWYCWGANESGVGDGTSTVRAVPTRVTAFGALDRVAPHEEILCGLATTGDVSCIGVEQEARLTTPIETFDPIVSPVDIDVSAATEIACGGGLCCAELSDRYRCWGIPASPVHGDGLRRDGTTNEPVGDLTGVTQVVAVDAAGACAIASGTVYCWGDGDNGRLGVGTEDDAWRPVAVTLPADAVELDAFRERTCARMTDGAVYCWGRGSPGDGTTADALTPRRVDASSMGTISDLAVGCSQSCALDASGAAWCWGNDACTSRTVCDGTCDTPLAVPGGHVFTAIDMGYSHACGLEADGDVWCWGSNFFGELGNGMTGNGVDSATPVQMVGATGVDQLALGWGYSCVRDGGRVRCLGDNGDYELGNGSTTDSTTLVTTIATGVTDVRCGITQCVARVASDWLGWGNNNGRSLDTSANGDVQVPTAIPEMSTWASVAPGPPISCGVLATGTAECFGNWNTSPARNRLALGLPVYSDLLIP